MSEITAKKKFGTPANDTCPTERIEDLLFATYFR